VQMELDSAGLSTREGLVQELEDARAASVAAIRSGVDRIRELQRQAQDDREKAWRDRTNRASRWSEIRRREGDLELKERDLAKRVEVVERKEKALEERRQQVASSQPDPAPASFQDPSPSALLRTFCSRTAREVVARLSGILRSLGLPGLSGASLPQVEEVPQMLSCMGNLLDQLEGLEGRLSSHFEAEGNALALEVAQHLLASFKHHYPESSLESIVGGLPEGQERAAYAKVLDLAERIVGQWKTTEEDAQEEGEDEEGGGDEGAPDSAAAP